MKTRTNHQLKDLTTEDPFKGETYTKPNSSPESSTVNS